MASTTSASFVVSLNNATVTDGRVGAGNNYTIVLSAPASWRGLLVSTQGVFLTDVFNSLTCMNRVVIAQDGTDTLSNYTTVLTLPCQTTGPLRVVLTFAYGGGLGAGNADGTSDQSWYQTHLTLTPDPTLAAPSCAGLTFPPLPPPSLPPPPPSVPAPPPPPMLSPPPVPSPAPPTHPVARGAHACAASTLGYQCSLPVGHVVLHWSLNTTLPPVNVCTGPASPTATAAPPGLDVTSGLLHMAVEADTPGYVSFAFTGTPGSMPHSDTILGWVNPDGSGHVAAYHVTGNFMSPSSIVSPSWAYQQAVSQTSDPLTHAKRTAICFSRPLATQRAAYSAALDLSAGLSYNWAISQSAALVQHSSAGVGGGTLDLQSGQSSATVDTKKWWINVHAACMSVAWGLLLPLGSLTPAHRWVLGDIKWGNKALWFVLHLTFQLAGFFMFCAGFVVSIIYFDLTSIPGGSVGQMHAYLGMVLMAMATLQVLGGAFRPAPGSAVRAVWNPIHHNMGRLAIMVSWVSLYSGVWIYSVSIYGGSLVQWLAPLASVGGTLLLIHVMLSVMRPAEVAADKAEEREMTDKASVMLSKAAANLKYRDNRPAHKHLLGETAENELFQGQEISSVVHLPAQVPRGMSLEIARRMSVDVARKVSREFREQFR
ncbi:MAG: hypothetical protein WDW36_004455 [Sanguina aurantia]